MSGMEQAVSYIVSIAFFVFAATTVVGALIAVLSARIIRSVCGLALCCVGMAGLYYFLHSPFLALMEVLIYVGAVCVTIVFAVMLAEPEESTKGETRGRALLWTTLALLVGAIIFWALLRLELREKWTAPAALLNDGSIRAIGVSLLTTYSLAFELISLALLVAILGALVIARAGRTQS